MSAAYKRKLTFKSNNLGKDANLVLVFDPLDSNASSVVWKSLSFGAYGAYVASITYYSQPAFSKPQVSNTGLIIADSAFRLLDYGQQTKLIKDNGLLSFTAPEQGITGKLTVKNGTSRPAAIALGFSDQAGVTPLYIWSDDQFPASGGITTQLTPVVRGYHVEDYQEGQILHGSISVSPSFQQDLSQLADDTAWIVSYDFSTGLFMVTAE